MSGGYMSGGVLSCHLSGFHFLNSNSFTKLAHPRVNGDHVYSKSH